MTAYTVSVNNNQFSLNATGVGAQGTQGNSVSNAYLDSNNDFIIEISNASGTVVQTINVGGGTIAGQLNEFDTTYLGPKTAAPTLNNSGNALIDGALFFNTTTNELGVYDLGTTTWEYPTLEATTSASNAATSENNAATSETNAATSETNAATSETNAATSATNAATSETNSATSATNAATSETNAAASTTAAQTAETNAETAETNAETAQAAAETAETNAATSETNAVTSASAASTSATNASNSETAAATSASNASTSETNAATSATNAATSATNAATSETTAATSASAASTSAGDAAASAASINLNSIDINGGTIDGTVIGGTTTAAVTGTTITATGAFTSPGIDDNATSTAMTLSASGKVGIGTGSPNGNLDISAGSTPQVILNNTDGTSNNSHDFRIATFGGLTPFWSSLSLDASSIQIKTFTTPRMTIDSSGNLMLGTTILGGTGGLTVSPNTTNGATAVVFNRNPAAGALSHVFDFRDGGASKGSIFYNSTSTLYNTSSDYRLKENITSIEGATDIVKAMNPCTYNFKGYSADWHDGFLAHELQELHPRAVVGEKDEMYDEEYEVTPAVYEDAVIPAVLDEEGNELEAERIERQVVAEAVIGTRSVPKYQSVDYAKLTPILTAALKEALTKIDDLETRLSAMEAAS
jgi:chemotaxis protein histidine kinase CheA